MVLAFKPAEVEQQSLTPGIPIVAPGRVFNVRDLNSRFQKIGQDFLDTYQFTEAEETQMRENPNIWASLKTAEDIFGLPLTKSGVEEFKGKSLGGKAWQVAQLGTWLVPGVVPVRTVGAGLRTAMRATKLENLFVRSVEMAPLANVATKLRPFVEETPFSVLTKRYRWAAEDAEAFLTGTADWKLGFHRYIPPEVLRTLDPRRLSKGEVVLKQGPSRVMKEAMLPVEVKLGKHYTKEFKRVVRSVYGKKIGKLELEPKIFQKILSDFKQPSLEGVTLETATPEVLANVSAKLLDEASHWRVGARLGVLNRFTPIRLALGKVDEFFGTSENIYEQGVEAYRMSNAYEHTHIQVFNSMLAEKGIVKMKGGPELSMMTPKLLIPRDRWRAAGKAIRTLDDLNAGEEASADEIWQYFASLHPDIQKIALTWWEYGDTLMLEHLDFKARQIFENTLGKNSPLGSVFEEFLMTKIFPPLQQAFSAGADKMAKGEMIGESFNLGKAEAWQQSLAQIREFLGSFAEAKPFKQKPEKLKALIDEFVPRSVEIGEEGEKVKVGKFINYLENYAPRIYTDRKVTNFRIAGLAKGKFQAFYTKSRTLDMPDEVIEDLTKMVSIRTRAQAKELHFYPALERITEYANRLPEDIKEFTAHWMFRMLGHPSPADVKMAAFLEGTVGKVEHWFGKPGVWDERRVGNLAYNINNLVYMGGLGFKPFSVLRNLFQPILTVPTDMGGIKDYHWLFQGLVKAAQPSTRNYIKNELKAIEEFAPELFLKATPAGAGPRLEIGKFGVELPEMQQVRDVSLYMFKLSDRWNRYLTGGAAIAKWDHFAAKFKLAEGGQARLSAFTDKMNINLRHKWVSTKLNDLLSTGGSANIEAAKRIFVKDVIGDTQFLYGLSESPLISHTLGGFGKTALVFQSWWMNYGAELAKWMTTGTLPQKSSRMLSFVVSAALAEQVMEPVWGRGSATKGTFLGPFPGEISEFAIPPTLAPFYHALGIGLGTLQGAWEGDLDAAERHLQRFIRTGTMFVPGGLQLYSSGKSVLEEGWEGLLPSIIRYKKDPYYEPLWGLPRKLG